MIVRPSYGDAGGDATHRFLTQRQSPSLATIDASIPVEVDVSDKLEDDVDVFDDDGGDGNKHENNNNNNNRDDPAVKMTATTKTKTKMKTTTRKTIIRLSHGEGDRRVHVHIDVTPSTLKSLPITYRAGLWEDVVTVVDVGDAAASFVANIIKDDASHFGDVRVVSVLGDGGRPIDERYCPDAARVGLLGALPQTGLTDGFPVSSCHSSL